MLCTVFVLNNAEHLHFINLNTLALKDSSVMVTQWNDRYSCWVVIWKGMDGPFKLRYCAGCSVH
jgi:hypothetical protein